MPEKDPTTYSLLTYAWVFALSAWGGIVSWIRKRNNGETRPFNLTEFIGEIITSAFAGIITFYLCESAQIAPVITAALVAVSGHMGTRAIYFAEQLLERKFKGPLL